VSKGELDVFAKYMEGTVMAILQSETDSTFRRAMNRVDIFLDLSSENLKRSNPNIFGSKHLTKEEQDMLMTLYRAELKRIIVPDYEFELTVLLKDPKGYMDRTRGGVGFEALKASKRRKTIFIEVLDEGALTGVLAIADAGSDASVFKSLATYMAKAANTLDKQILGKNLHSSVRSVDPSKPSKGKRNKGSFKTALDLGHVGLGDSAGRTPLLDKLLTAQQQLRDMPASTAAQKSAAARLDRFIQKGIQRINRAHATYFQHVQSTRAINDMSLNGAVQVYYALTQQSDINQVKLGRDVEKRTSDRMTKHVGAYFKKHDILTMKGSPSFLSLLKLSAISLITKGKGIRQSWKTKATDKKSKSVPLKDRGVMKKAPAGGVSLSNLAGGDDSTGGSILTVQNLINNLLHDRIQSNMGSPKLNYRTGRFARSARIVKTIQTREGFKIFRYTYMTNPYATFEVGGEQGSTERDPRPLIEQSIREIAYTMVGAKMKSEPI
jgi:hypothetical protein